MDQEAIRRLVNQLTNEAERWHKIEKNGFEAGRRIVELPTGGAVIHLQCADGSLVDVTVEPVR